MHETFIDNEYNKSIITSTQRALDNCNEQLAVTTSIETMEGEAMEMAVEELAVADSIMDIDEEKADLAMKQWKKERRKKIWAKIEKWVFLAGGFLVGTQVK